MEPAEFSWQALVFVKHACLLSDAMAHPKTCIGAVQCQNTTLSLQLEQHECCEHEEPSQTCVLVQTCSYAIGPNISQMPHCLQQPIFCHRLDLLPGSRWTALHFALCQRLSTRIMDCPWGGAAGRCTIVKMNCCKYAWQATCLCLPPPYATK